MDLPLLYEGVNTLLFLTALVYLISSMDDLFIDIVFWTRFTYLKIFNPSYFRMDEEILRTKEERPLAVMVPAWQEHDVIAQMVMNTQRTVEYKDYVIFIGVYHNDPRTNEVVDLLVNDYDNVIKAVVPHDGPTCKADCLNWVTQAISAYERKHRRRFRMAVMHDSEDIIHPLEFRLFNHLIDTHDFIQIPVRPLEREWYQFISGSYMDEFAEFHAKDMVVRNILSGIVPSAGVSTCFCRDSLTKLAELKHGEIFNTSSLTEDYEIGYKFATLNLKQKFSKFWLDISLTPKNRYKGKAVKHVPLAVGEYFPHTLWTAIRQKTRWNIGIFFQSAGKLTWKGSFFTKYFFFRDRKGILTNLLILPAYFLAFVVIALWTLGDLKIISAFELTVPAWLLWTNFFLFAQRMTERFLFTKWSYGWKEACLSLPRILCSNIINLCSTFRALYIYIRALILKEKIAWDKTTHFYPALEIPEPRKQGALGDYLIKNNIISSGAYAALLRHRDLSRKNLGEILLEEGLITREQLLTYISTLTGYPVADLSQVNAENASPLLPASLIRKHGIFPLGQEKGKHLKVAASGLIPEDVMQRLREHGHPSIRPFLLLEQEIQDLIKTHLPTPPRTGSEPAPADTIKTSAHLHKKSDIPYSYTFTKPVLPHASVPKEKTNSRHSIHDQP